MGMARLFKLHSSLLPNYGQDIACHAFLTIVCNLSKAVEFSQFLGTVRNNQLTATATDQEVEAYIKRWLHLAGDRDGGRREREEKRRASQHTGKSATIPILQYM